MTQDVSGPIHIPTTAEREAELAEIASLRQRQEECERERERARRASGALIDALRTQLQQAETALKRIAALETGTLARARLVAIRALTSSQEKP